MEVGPGEGGGVGGGENAKATGLLGVWNNEVPLYTRGRQSLSSAW